MDQGDLIQKAIKKGRLIILDKPERVLNMNDLKDLNLLEEFIRNNKDKLPTIKLKEGK